MRGGWRRDDVTRRGWTMDDARRHAEAVAEFDAQVRAGLLKRCTDAELVEALRPIGAVTVSWDWQFFAASRAIREQARAVSA